MSPPLPFPVTHHVVHLILIVFDCFNAESNTGESTVVLHQRVSAKQLVRRQPFFEKLKSGEEEDSEVVSVAEVAETEMADVDLAVEVAAEKVDEESMVEDRPLLEEFPGHRGSTDQDNDGRTTWKLLHPSHAFHLIRNNV